MKVAVCFSGKTYPDSGDLVRLMHKRFPTWDFFYGTWEGCESPFPEETMYWPEPEIDYHPCLDIDLKEFPFTKLVNLRKNPRFPFHKAAHQTKQIIAHSYMIDNLPEEYDMVIRCRWDLHFYDPKLILENFVDKSYNENKAIGFSKKLGGGDLWSAKGTNRHHWWDGFLMDLMIIHPRNLFDKEKMWELHNTKRLCFAEFGWYQVLSVNDNHESWFAKIGMTSRDGWTKA